MITSNVPHPLVEQKPKSIYPIIKKRIGSNDIILFTQKAKGVILFSNIDNRMGVYLMHIENEEDFEIYPYNVVISNKPIEF
jgi:hypothetical protein